MKDKTFSGGGSVTGILERRDRRMEEIITYLRSMGEETRTDSKGMTESEHVYWNNFQNCGDM